MSAPRCHWSYTALRPRLFLFDARLVFPLGIWLLHWSRATLAAALLSAALFLALERLGIPFDCALLRLRSRLAGPVRHAVDPAILRRRCRY
ncbi:MAG: IcmT/TraK family protein [Deltaproteobacteria bacterium]|jgi:hypothetical protein|nr:IcmT/TraK family protein [Deltaproteobacteria bacterium]